jgi:hypothetical protein
VPRHKSDNYRAEKLKQYTYEEVKPIIPDLLKWLQDMNWPVALPVATYLCTISDRISGDIASILRGEDEVWKYWCLNVFVVSAASIPPEILSEVKRIASTPTQGEIGESLHELAVEILRDYLPIDDSSPEGA